MRFNSNTEGSAIRKKIYLFENGSLQKHWAGEINKHQSPAPELHHCELEFL
jgi:hypothetical protein